MSESSSTDEAHRRKSTGTSEEPGETRKLADKNRTHSFILDLEQGSEELLRPRSSGKFDRHSRKDQHAKDRKEKDRERSVSDDSAKIKQKADKKAELHGEESSHKDGAEAKVSSEDKGEKKPSKLKADRKSSSVSREARSSVSEGSAVEDGQKDAGSKKTKVPTGETLKDKEKEKDRTKAEKDKEKVGGKGDPRHPDSTGSSEERPDLEPGTEGNKKKEKLIKEVLKRSKSTTDAKQADTKQRSRLDSKDSDKEKTRGLPDLQRSISETEGEARRSREVEPGSKAKLSEKSRSKSREDPKTPTPSKTDKKGSTQDAKGKSTTSVSKADTTKEKKKDTGADKKEKKPSEEHPPEKTQEAKSGKKQSEKKVKDSEKKGETQGARARKSVDVTTTSPLSPCMPETATSVQAPKEPKDPGMEVDSAGSTIITATAATTTVRPSDDAFDALSDITPEPEGESVAARLAEFKDEEEQKEEPRPVPAEADALLSLMEVCSSAERSVVTETAETREEVTSSAAATAGMSLQEADLKMKEAALTLLSMDPDLTLSPSLIDRHMAPVPEQVPPPPQDIVTTAREAPPQEPMVVDSSGNDVHKAESSQTLQEMPEAQHVQDEGIASTQYPPVSYVYVLCLHINHLICFCTAY